AEAGQRGHPRVQRRLEARGRERARAEAARAEALVASMTDPEALSPVFAREPRPQVSQPSSPWTVILGIGGCVALGVVVFTSLSSARQAHAAGEPPKPAASAPPAWAAGVA